MTAWTEQKIETLMAGYRAGDSASQIGNTLGITRNAVIGKLHRMGHKRGKAVPQPREPKPERKHYPRTIRPRQQFPERPAAPVDDTEAPQPQPCPLFDLTNETCRWPSGHPGNKDFFFCGHPSADMIAGRPYCPYHTNIAKPSTAPRSLDGLAKFMSDPKAPREAAA